MSTTTVRTAQKPTTRAALGAAVVWSLVLLVAGFVLPVYGSDSVVSSGTSGDVSDPGTTLVDVNGIGIAFVLAVPLVASLVVAGLLWRTPRRAALVTAWIVTGVLGAFNVLALLSIGVLVLPVTAALVVACATTRSPPA